MLEVPRPLQDIHNPLCDICPCLPQPRPPIMATPEGRNGVIQVALAKYNSINILRVSPCASRFCGDARWAGIRKCNKSNILPRTRENFSSPMPTVTTVFSRFCLQDIEMKGSFPSFSANPMISIDRQGEGYTRYQIVNSPRSVASTGCPAAQFDREARFFSAEAKAGK